MLVTADFEGAYLTISNEDGNNCLNEALKERNYESIPSHFLVKLLDLIKKYNIFECYGYKHGEGGNLVLKRFLDNLFQIYKGTTKNIHKIYEEINQIHSSLTFTMEYTTPEN